VQNSSFQISYSLDNIKNAAKQFWQLAKQCHVLAFSGQLGAGKTTFIHALCEYLNVEDVVSSPTFALINEYHFHADEKENIIYHMDWYRLKDEQEAIDAGMEDCLLNKDVYCFVEWPEKAPGLLTGKYLWVDIEMINSTERLLAAHLR